ncbi:MULTISPECIES: PAAR domain-containing protein [unclassified Pseudomonas]|uniref:PAAR domain-containing protein n=1 Tax=unclassified Pseudomonas TaxID=196821 RepID=UPI002449152F|nr:MULTISPECIES: PAAR domain-containing protein [unclassified Pseudomonas]MDG9923387.1 PAAR domain-containing protein [Pseudomonas sp. GD04045]MDH0035489.1 PAAR domain-containing protein [Pseudomonas sp. GD04019]
MSGKPAARLGDPTACPVPGHGTNPIAAGSPNVLFDGLPAARMGDASACGGALSGNVIPTVLINGKPATTIGSVGSHGNVVVAGSGTVLIGASGGGAAFVAPAPVKMPGFDEQFVLTDEQGEPIANQPYMLVRENGAQESGTTDAQGRTHRIAPHTKAEKIDIYLATEG